MSHVKVEVAVKSFSASAIGKTKGVSLTPPTIRNFGQAIVVRLSGSKKSSNSRQLRLPFSLKNPALGGVLN